MRQGKRRRKEIVCMVGTPGLYFLSNGSESVNENWSEVSGF